MEVLPHLSTLSLYQGSPLLSRGAHLDFSPTRAARELDYYSPCQPAPRARSRAEPMAGAEWPTAHQRGSAAGGPQSGPTGPRSGPAAPRRGGTGPEARRERPQGRVRSSRRAARPTQGRPEGSKGEPGRPGGAGEGGPPQGGAAELRHPARRRPQAAKRAGRGAPRRHRDGRAHAPTGQGRGRGREPTTAPAPRRGEPQPRPRRRRGPAQ